MIEVIRHTEIKLKEIVFAFNEDQPDKALSDYVESFNLFPTVLIGKSDNSIIQTIDPGLIDNIKLTNSKFLPEIEMLCKDDIGILMDSLFPLDYDTILSIFVKSTSEETLPIRMDFKIIEFNPIKTSVDSTDKIFIIKGILNVEKLHYTTFEVFPQKTSYNLLDDLTKTLKLGFATNISNTNDNMSWINPADTYLNFIQNVTKRSYISDDSFVWSFIDFYYNLNFVDIEKELYDKPKNIQSLNSTTINTTDEESEDDWVELYLSTSDNLGATNKYISKYNLNNKSLKSNLESGYQYSTRWFNKSENTIEHVLTRENKTENKNLTQLITEEPISDMNWGGSFLGKVDEDNVHKNYHLALTINEFNISKLHKVVMTVTLQTTNFEVRRFQNIAVDFVDINLLNDATADIKEKLSGYWFVTGIDYSFSKNIGATQEVTMVRRDLNLKYTELHDIRKILNEKNK